jgi:AbrB family looped-hinge helix DNA binding protein
LDQQTGQSIPAQPIDKDLVLAKTRSMSKVTSKLQVTIPKAIAERLSIAPGDELEWVAGADSVRLVPAKARKPAPNAAARLKLFDAATERQHQRELQTERVGSAAHRGWSREELYQRGGSG